MKAVVYLGPGRMEVQDVPEPRPASGEVIIHTSASAICGSDLHGFRAASPRRIPPLIMGHETVGTIVDVGDGVDPARVGTRVVLRPILSCGSCEACTAGRANLCVEGRLVGRDLAGGFAERFAVPAAAAVELGSDVPDDMATLVEPIANAIHVTSRAVRNGDEVLVIGAGPLGVLMAAMSIDRGARRVFVTDRNPARLELARAQGTVPVEVGRVEEALMDAAPDVVIDAVGVEDTWRTSLRAVRAGGRIEVVGLGAPNGDVDFFGVIGKEAVITGSFACTDDEFAAAAALITRAPIDTTGWFTRAPFAEAPRLFHELAYGMDLFKVVLTPDGSES